MEVMVIFAVIAWSGIFAGICVELSRIASAIEKAGKR